MIAFARQSPEVDNRATALSADEQLAVGVVPGVGAFDDLALSGLDQGVARAGDRPRSPRAASSLRVLAES